GIEVNLVLGNYRIEAHFGKHDLIFSIGPKRGGSAANVAEGALLDAPHNRFADDGVGCQARKTKERVETAHNVASAEAEFGRRAFAKFEQFDDFPRIEAIEDSFFYLRDEFHHALVDAGFFLFAERRLQRHPAHLD